MTNSAFLLLYSFIQALTYNIADPDDGSCERMDSAESCDKLKSDLAAHESKCYWNEAQSQCHFREIQGEFSRVLIVALISAVLGTPFAFATEYILSSVLSADVSSTRRPLPVQVSATKGTDVEANSPRFTVIVAQHANAMTGVTIFDEYSKMLTELKSYRDTLSLEERRDFEGGS
jgi:hypothetical protein